MKCGGRCKRKPSPARSPDAPGIPWRRVDAALAALLLALLCACQSGSGAPTKPLEADPVAARLMGLPFDAMTGLGPHHMTATLKVSDEADKRSFASTEVYDLRWEGWRRYAYRVTKEERPTMDVVVAEDRAYQLRPDGLARPRENVHDFHYYLQQTWNQWSTAVRPFGDDLTLTPVETASRDGRPTTRFQVGLRRGGLIVDDSAGTGTMRTILATAEGYVWLDDTTGVPLEAQFEGSYKTIRVSRVPGKPDAETVHRISLALGRDGIGQEQTIEIPPVAPAPKPRPKPTGQSPSGGRASPRRRPR